MAVVPKLLDDLLRMIAHSSLRPVHCIRIVTAPSFPLAYVFLFGLIYCRWIQLLSLLRFVGSVFVQGAHLLVHRSDLAALGGLQIPVQELTVAVVVHESNNLGQGAPPY